jgi:shikimate kinase
MGSGKSTVGELLARQIGWPFIDLDSTIEAGQKTTIREIFERVGEPFFRAVESAALAEISKKEPAVIALGGGTWVQQSNLEFVRSTGGTTIWLDCSLEELLRRCNSINNRPLFRDAESFSQLLSQRLPYYQLAEFRVPTDGFTPEEIVEQILQLKIF